MRVNPVVTHFGSVPILISLHKVLVHLLHQEFTIDESVPVPQKIISSLHVLHFDTHLGQNPRDIG